ncbi:polysaccharide deacetylase family protein, partial [Alphaproteobacteria bacterium]|nr:polysaccharide deacetylase family protein [Alphaproteobacteria bacterium]
TNKLLDVHRIHLLLNRVNDNLLLKNINIILKKKMILKKEFKFFKNNTYLNQVKNSKTEIKKILNYMIKPEYRETILDQLFDIFQLEFNLSNFYLNKRQILTMSKNGMIFGSHTFSHKVLSLLANNIQEKEILMTDNFINNIHKQAFKTFCIPYGTQKTFNQNTINILNKRKFNFSFAVKSKNITKYDYKKNINNLPRFDCNEFIN